MAINEGQPQETQKPNVRLAHKQSPVTVDGPVNIGTVTVDLPSEAEQRAGFCTPDASTLIAQFYPKYLYLRGAGSSQQGIVATQAQIETGQETLTEPVEALDALAKSDTEYQETLNNTTKGGETHNGTA